MKKATLRLDVTGSTSNGPAVYVTSNSWSESLLNWSNQPLLMGAALHDKGALAANAWTEYNMTAAIGADGTYSFALEATSDDSVFFSSREATLNKPELIVEY